MRTISFSKYVGTAYKMECLAEFDGPVTVTDAHGDAYAVEYVRTSVTPDGDALLLVPVPEGTGYLFIDDIREIKGRY